MNPSPDVVLLRSPDDEMPDRYVAALDRAGWRAACEPVLAFSFPRATALRDRLTAPDPYAGLIATSPRVATALTRALADRDPLHKNWGARRVYAVGPKTADHLRALGLEPQGDETGSAQALATYIVDDAPSGLLLFLSGNRRRDTLPESLRDAGVPFEELVVYETHPRTELDLPAPSGAPWLVFFSPSGLEAVEAQYENSLDEYRLAAIGPTTGKALARAGYSVEAVAEAPSPDGLVAALRAADTAPSGG
jgi:uroporphyrinogen-III synthase